MCAFEFRERKSRKCVLSMRITEKILFTLNRCISNCLTPTLTGWWCCFSQRFRLFTWFFCRLCFMFDQNHTCLITPEFSSESQPKYLQICSNHFLHHSKAPVFSLAALLSLDQERLFISIHKTIVPFCIWIHYFIIYFL